MLGIALTLVIAAVLIDQAGWVCYRRAWLRLGRPDLIQPRQIWDQGGDGLLATMLVLGAAAVAGLNWIGGS